MVNLHKSTGELVSGFLGRETTGQMYLATPTDQFWEIRRCDNETTYTMVGRYTPLELKAWSSNETRIVDWTERSEMAQCSVNMLANRKAVAE